MCATKRQERLKTHNEKTLVTLIKDAQQLTRLFNIGSQRTCLLCAGHTCCRTQTHTDTQPQYTYTCANRNLIEALAVASLKQRAIPMTALMVMMMVVAANEEEETEGEKH